MSRGSSWSSAATRASSSAARHPNRPLKHGQIMEQAHSQGGDVFDRSIELRVMRLRRKVERNPDKPEGIKPDRNVGYVYVSAS
jgi:two-component system phosphate regulon response regulator OmpR